MSATQVPGDKLKKALTLLTELCEQYPDKSKRELLRQIEMQLDLSPLESEFLNKNFCDSPSKK